MYLWPSGIIYGRLMKFVVICYTFPVFGTLGPRKIWQPFLEVIPKLFNAFQVGRAA
jgi:hypothetical protein